MTEAIRIWPVEEAVRTPDVAPQSDCPDDDRMAGMVPAVLLLLSIPLGAMAWWALISHALSLF